MFFLLSPPLPRRVMLDKSLVVSAMITHIHHINILVRNLDASVTYWSGLLGKSADIQRLEGRGVTTARYQLGQTHLVLVSPESPESVLWPLLETQGEGLFLLSLGTDDLENALNTLADQSIESTSAIRQGLLNWQVCDIASPAMGEHILQLCQEK